MTGTYHVARLRLPLGEVQHHRGTPMAPRFVSWTHDCQLLIRGDLPFGSEYRIAFCQEADIISWRICVRSLGDLIPAQIGNMRSLRFAILYDLHGRSQRAEM